MDEIRKLSDAIAAFNRERDWEQFHNTKDVALAISIEAGELLEQFLWKQPGQENVEKVKEELADILTFAFLMASKYGFDVAEIVTEKIEMNKRKYPVDKAKGSAKKYNEL
ncbi:MAG TPA: nucleotide pyrophosphohydrolase [Chitinophagaceae bacterium]